MELPVTADTLGELDDGAARLVINKQIEAAVFDAWDRGEDKKPRQVLILLELNRMENGLIVAHVEASAKVPKYRTRGTVSTVRQAGGVQQIMFQQFCPADPRQRTMDEVENTPDADEKKGHYGDD